MKTENWIHGWLKSIWKSKEVPNYRREKNLAKLYNQEKNLLQQKRENKIFTYWRDDLFGKKSVPDHKKAEALETIDYKECGCLPDCGCKDTYKPDDTQITIFDT